MRAAWAMVAMLAAAGPALAQGSSSGIPGLGSSGGIPGLGQIPGLTQPETPEQKRAFCQRVAAAGARCMASGGLSLDMVALTSCLVRSLQPQDSMRVAQVANSSRGSAGALMSECGLSLGR